MIIKVNGISMNLQEGDKVEFDKIRCGRCETTHDKITVIRGHTVIAHFGEYVGLHDTGEDELYGGVVLDENGDALPEYHRLVHIMPQRGGLTPDGMSYVPLCGVVLDHKGSVKWDGVTWHPEHNNPDLICPECLKIHEGFKLGIMK